MMLTMARFHPIWDRSVFSPLRGAALKHNEDVLDAIVVLYIGALYAGWNSERVISLHGTRANIYCPQGANCNKEAL